MTITGYTSQNQATLNMNPALALGMQDLYTAVATAPVGLALGTTIRLADGREFVYGKAGAVALAPGKLTQTAIPSANANNEAVTAAAAAGTDIIYVTFGGAVTANQYRGGFLWVNDADGEGQIFTIKSHPAGTTAVKVEVFETVRTALTTSSEVSAVVHPMSGLLVCPTSLTGAVCGVPLIAVTAAYYAWFQTKGACPVLGNGTVVVGNPVTPSGTTAGAVDAYNEDGTANLPIVGIVLGVNASTEYSLINLAIPGF